MSSVVTVVRYALGESVRRRMLHVVLVLTGAFLLLFWVGTSSLVANSSGFVPPLDVDRETLVGSTLLGLAMFATLFLGSVLTVFLTLNAVRGDAERGLLQPLVVRPLGRATYLAARFLAAASVAAIYVLAVYASAVLIVRSEVGWWPDRIVSPGLELAAAVAVVAALSLLGSVFLSSTANGVAIFMLFGAGLVGGLLGQIGEALDSDTLRGIGRDSARVLPFEALYQDGLHRLTIETTGLTEFVVELGPFGGAQAGGPWLWPWTLAYVVAAGAVAIAAFRRRDL